MSKDLNQTRERVTHQNGKPWTGKSGVWSREQQEAPGQWRQVMGASQGMAGTLNFFCTHQETIGGFRGKDDVVWLHFGKGRSGCFERRERVGRQACEAYC